MGYCSPSIHWNAFSPFVFYLIVNKCWHLFRFLFYHIGYQPIYGTSSASYFLQHLHLFYFLSLVCIYTSQTCHNCFSVRFSFVSFYFVHQYCALASMNLIVLVFLREFTSLLNNETHELMYLCRFESIYWKW